MANSRLLLIAALVVLNADAQQPTQGYAAERFYPSAPGGGWFVMDDLNLGGGFGGAISLTGGYARDPIPGISSQSFIDVGLAATYHRYRVYVNLPVPVASTGAPAVSPGTNPDTISDTRVGFDALLLGKPGNKLRFGAGAQLLIPSGARTDFVSDGRYRGMFRFLAAGDARGFTYAGQLGLHVRPVEGGLPQRAPDGNEILFGIAGGRKMSVGNSWALIVGPEFFGETAIRSSQTGFEGLMTGRLEGTGAGRHLRVKLGIGHAIVQSFGAPEWRILAGVELFGRN